MVTAPAQFVFRRPVRSYTDVITERLPDSPASLYHVEYRAADHDGHAACFFPFAFSPVIDTLFRPCNHPPSQPR